MSKKQLPKRNVSFKLEKHPTAERLDLLRAQGIETIDDLDRFSETISSVNPELNSSPMLNTSTVATDKAKVSTIDNSLNVVIGDKPSVVIDSSTSVAIDNKLSVGIKDILESKEELKDKEDILNTSYSSSLVSRKENSYTDINELVSTTASYSSIDTPIDIVSSTNTATDNAIDHHTAIATTTIKTGFTNPIDLFNYLQQTHSSSAQLIYKLIYKLSNERGRQTLRIGTKELLEKTKIKSHVTVRKAIDELIIKCSLELIEANQGKIPPVYRITPLEEVFSKREEKEFVIDEDTKFLFQRGKRIWPNTIDKIADDTTSLPTSNAISKHTPSTIGKDIASHTVSSTISSKDNSSFLLNTQMNEVRGICEELGVKIVNSPKLVELENYSLSHVIIGICKKVEESGKNSLTILDCLEEIKNHHKSMKSLPESILSKVAYDYFLRANK